MDIQFKDWILYEKDSMQVFLKSSEGCKFLVIKFFKKADGLWKSFDSASWRELSFVEFSRDVFCRESLTCINEDEQKLVDLINKTDKRSRKNNHIRYIGKRNGNLYHASNDVLKIAWKIYREFSSPL